MSAWVRPGNLAANVTLFGRRLRGRGLLVGPAEIGLALRGLAETSLWDRDEVRLALRTIFCSRGDDLPVFDDEFARFWSESPLGAALPHAGAEDGEPAAREQAPGTEQEGQLTVTEWSGEGISEEDERAVPAYSPAEIRARKDFSAFSADDLEAISELIVLIARRIAMRLSRRMRSDRRGSLVDLRRTMRRSLQFGGDAVDLVWQRRRIRKARLVLLCDVSGSMDIYSRFLVQFIYALQGMLGRVESFLFSTSLTRVTDALDHRDIREALLEASRRVPDWSGGTKIGASLRTFNETYGRRLVDPRTIVVVCSDGWDTGDADVLASAMRALRARAGRLIWLNPLLGSPGYEPVTQGMNAALPFVDVFASAHNIRSLRELERHLREPRRRRPFSPAPSAPGMVPRGETR
ncbi:MAG TPA: VWA domain-containing protein [bacterium]|nr:VWA domain-containing protein [bacterium]